MSSTQNDKWKEASLMVCIPCYIEDTITRYPRGLPECPRCGRDNNKVD
jgi:hypothetical protein